MTEAQHLWQLNIEKMPSLIKRGQNELVMGDNAGDYHILLNAIILTCD